MADELMSGTEAAAHYGALRRERDQGPADKARPQTELQRRVRDALEMHDAVEGERRAKGGPDDLGELDRELTMIEGALQGVYQRFGETVAAVRPVLDPKALHALLEAEPHSLHSTVDSLAPRTVVGERVRRLQYALSELEQALAFVGNGVRL